MNKKFSMPLAFVFGLLGFLAWQYMNQSVNPESSAPQVDQASSTPVASTSGDTESAVVKADDAPNTAEQSAGVGANDTVKPDAAVQDTGIKDAVINPMTGLPPDKNDPKLIAKRKQVYMDITDIGVNMARGEKPAPKIVIGHAKDITMLTGEGYIPSKDALNTLIYLRKAFPELDIELNQQMEAIKQQSS